MEGIFKRKSEINSFGKSLTLCQKEVGDVRATAQKTHCKWRPSFYSPARVSLVPILPAGFQIPATRSYHTPHFHTTHSPSLLGRPFLSTTSYTHPPPPAPPANEYLCLNTPAYTHPAPPAPQTNEYLCHRLHFRGRHLRGHLQCVFCARSQL
jgi:hypothetical protein